MAVVLKTTVPETVPGVRIPLPPNPPKRFYSSRVGPAVAAPACLFRPASALRKLVVVDAAETLDDLRVPPGNRLEKLSGKRSGQYSIRVNDQWRVCFRWRDRDAFDVELVDYH